ncbi:MAG: hypothetical protein NW237_13460 [Cyanobacteriota bacterium]|nr:hypothetical protein [Cyanobacteriota bacterium]
MNSSPAPAFGSYSVGAEVADYVTQLQLHMALQARHLIPGFHHSSTSDSRLQLLQQTQADLEKSASRQWF